MSCPNLGAGCKRRCWDCPWAPMQAASEHYRHHVGTYGRSLVDVALGGQSEPPYDDTPEPVVELDFRERT